MRVNCVGAVVFDDSGRLLLIRRGHPPGEGLWSLPGGRVEPGESDHQALARELLEETGLRVSVVRLAGAVERPGGAPGVVYVIRDYLATPDGDTALTAGDDAADARWVPVPELDRLPMSPGVLDALREWGLIGGRSSATG
ncbi:NUDIX hydrolase [Spongiactinospora rosea]|uniref:NUDIX hydrolase n=1 Tax=Spongiactinospora rosea TaxID=2248750 RepID=A0A366LXI8_9ACTN|nr:NUDIX hydrolase [Spongiactinospora rosea]RBQ18487.1 NUDIX hydrolase [Spongiactinospora rosea]